MARGTILGIFIFIMIVTTRIGVMSSNKLYGDLSTFDTQKEYYESYKKIDQVKTLAKNDLYKNPEGYVSTDETVYIQNPMEKVICQLRFEDFLLEFDEPLFVVTDTGAYLTKPFPNFQWKFDDSIIKNWDGKFLELKEEGGVKYYINMFSVEEHDVEALSSIYDLSHYDEIVDLPMSEIELADKVGILIKTQNNAVVSYAILQTESKNNYTNLIAYDFQGNKVLEIYRDSVSRYMLLPGGEIESEVTGHKIRLAFDYMEAVSVQMNEPYFTLVDSSVWQGEMNHNEDSLNLNFDGSRNNYLELEIYGTDNISLTLGYQKFIK